ncbi:MAG: T9SS type A sorting domain-containing protein [Bacteroidia bacterium]
MRIKIIYVAIIICLANMAKGQLAGNYSIGSIGQDYTTIESAVDDLYNQGVKAPVIFRLTDTVYNEKIAFNGAINGASIENQIMFISDNEQEANIEGDGLNLLELNGVSHLVFKKINFFSTNANGNCILLENKMRNCRITGCNFRGAKNSIQFEKQVVQSKISIDSCVFSKFSANAIFTQDCDSISIHANRFLGDLKVRYAVLGFNLTNVQVSNNYFNELAVQLDGSKIDFINNIGNLGETGWFNFQQSDSLRFLHNSVYSNSNSFSVLFRDQSALQVENNIVQNDSTGWAIEAIECEGEVFENNIIYSNDVLVKIREGFSELSYSLIDSANAYYETNSNFSLNPEFDNKSIELRQMANAPIYDGGYCGVNYDCDGNVRCFQSPTIGAYELSKRFGKYNIFSELSDTLYLDQNEELTLDLDLNAPDIGSGFWQIGATALNNQVKTYKLNRTKPGKEVVFLFRNKCISGDTSFRIFTILDTIKPKINIDSLQYAEQCDFFTPKYQIKENDLDTLIFGGTWPNHTLSAGEYVLELTAIDNSGNFSKAKSIIKVIDNTPPILRLLGSSVDTVANWEHYVDKGVKAIDPCNETYKVKTWSTSNIDTTAGTGFFNTQYWAKDSSGNVTGPVTRYFIKTSVGANFANNSYVTLYPNPSKGLISLKMNSLQSEVRLELFQIDGQKVFDRKVMSSKAISLHGMLENGVYLVKITSRSESYFSKLIIE